MKVLFIHNKYQQYGGEDVVLKLEASLLKEKGHDVQVLIFDNKEINSIFSKIRIGLSALYNFSSAQKLNVLIKEFKPDIIHIHNIFFIASPSLAFIAHRNKIPVVLTLHNYRLVCANATLLRNQKLCELCIHKKFPLLGIRHKCYRNSAIESALVTFITSIHKILNTWKNKITLFIALNDFSRSKLLNSSLEIPAYKMVVKPNFVYDQGEGIYPRDNFFLFAGRIAKEKGVYILAKAFAAMPEYKIIILGDGPELNTLRQEFKDYPHIIFKGQCKKNEVTEYMKRCKALICPSIWYEGTNLSIIEAFATGTPIIASRPKDSLVPIIDGFNGLHFTPGDADDLQSKIKQFESEIVNNRLLYNNARQTYFQNYHPDIHYNAILKIYKKAIESKLSGGMKIIHRSSPKLRERFEQVSGRLLTFFAKTPFENKFRLNKKSDEVQKINNF